ncbi:hypothetical protein ACPA9J_28085 [Pseudomonas aeruginosa]
MRLLPGLLERPEFRTRNPFPADDADLRSVIQLARRWPGPVRPVPGLSRRTGLDSWSQGRDQIARGERAGAPARCRRALAGQVARAARRRRCR